MPAGLSRIACPVLLGLVLATGVAAQGRPVDETALRFYAAQGQVERAQAEGRRLAALNPGWSVPDDVWTAQPGRADEKPLWQLFARDDLDGLKRAIAARRRGEPNWRPSDDLARKLQRKELRQAVLARAGNRQWQAVAELGEAAGKSGDVEDVELAWTIAEGLARSDRRPEAFALLSTILAKRTDPKERRATIHKAIALLPIADVEMLLAMGKTDADGAPEFAALALDVTRARIGAVLHDERSAAIDPAELGAFEAPARASATPDDAALVAWLALKRNRPAEALDWFKLAIGRGGDAMVAHGLAHTLLRLGKRREAEAVAFAWREPLVNNAILFIDLLEPELTHPSAPAIEPERLARYARVTLESRSGEGAQALGWYAYNACQFETALDWFRRATAWMPKEATVYGQALTLQRLKRPREFAELLNRYDGLFPSVVGLALPQAASGGSACDAAPARVTDANARVPLPGSAATVDAVQMLRRAGFPAAVAPENPLRFPQPQRLAGAADVTAARPMVARRVTGVPAMPYERLGFALLPGWSGQTQAAASGPSDQPPARGTLWSEEPARTTPAAEPDNRDRIADLAANRFRR